MAGLGAGLALVVATVAWWLFAAPVTTSSAVSSLVVQDEASGWDGAIMAPIMVGAAWAAGLVPAAFERTWVWIGVAASTVAAGVLVSVSIETVAGELATLGAEDIAGMPLPPHAVGTWAVLVLVTVVGAAVVASYVRWQAVSRAVAAALFAAYAVVAVLLAGVAGGIEGYGFAALTGLAGIWLAARLWRP